MSFGQGGPGGGPGGSSAPDWEALAERAESARARRRRWLLVGGGAVAAAAVAAVVATAVVTEGGDAGASDMPSASLPPSATLPPSPEQPEATFSSEPPPPPPDPLEFISDAAKDTAPLGPDTLFPGSSMTMNGRTYAKGATSSTEDCAAAAQGGLGPVLSGNDCRRLIRATYTRDGIAVTVGVAVFDDAAAAERAKEQSRPNVASLPGAGVPTFCRGVTCRSTANALGRYAYFTIAGHTSGESVTASDTAARRAGLDAADLTFARILHRGEEQASAAADG